MPLGIDLELEAQERAVGLFRADVLCKDIGTHRWVLIEKPRHSALMDDEVTLLV
jgi:hypothetical protein